MEHPITLSIVTPSGMSWDVRCDSVRFDVPDGVKKKNSGGSVGIRKGHADALMSVAAGKVLAKSGGGVTLDCTVDSGLAVISSDTVTILTDRITVHAIAEEYRKSDSEEE